MYLFFPKQIEGIFKLIYIHALQPFPDFNCNQFMPNTLAIASKSK